MDTRSNMQGKARALATATRVSESYLGMALLRNHDGEDRTYMEKLRGLEKENRSVQNELDHQRMQFLKRRLGTPGPIIILEQTRDPLSKDGDGNGRRGRRPKPRGREAVHFREAAGRNGSRPGYMMPTMSRGTVICSTSTTGAFRISTQRPLDRWNPAVLQKIYFKSAVMPSWPLTDSDLGELRTTLSRHCWIRKFRDPPGQVASAESGSRSSRSSKRYHRGSGLVKGPSDEQVEKNRQGCGREEEPKIPGINGSQSTDSRVVNVKSRSHSQPITVESRRMNLSTTKSAEIEQRHQLLPALTANYRSKVVKPKTKPLNKNSSTLSKAQPLPDNEEEHFFKTSIEYSIPSVVTDPGNNDDSNNTIPLESRVGKANSASDALPEVTSTRNLLKSLRAVSFSDDVISISCRPTEIDGA